MFVDFLEGGTIEELHNSSMHCKRIPHHHYAITLITALPLRPITNRCIDTKSTMLLDREPKHPNYPVEDKRRNELCVQLLDVIANSVTTFRPSESLTCLPNHGSDSRPKTPAAEIDLVISGGGLKGYFVTGCSHVLLKELNRQNIAVNRIAGASAGAWVGLFMLTGFGTENWIETYYKCKERSSMTMHEAYDDIWPWINTCLPEDAYKICSGRLFISITEVSWKGFTNHMISEYTSNRDLFDACLASSTVPFLSLPQCCRRYRDMWVIDGGVTINTPVFLDHARRQLVFRLSDVFYPGRLLINPGGKLFLQLFVEDFVHIIVAFVLL